MTAQTQHGHLSLHPPKIQFFGTWTKNKPNFWVKSSNSPDFQRVNFSWWSLGGPSCFSTKFGSKALQAITASRNFLEFRGGGKTHPFGWGTKNQAEGWRVTTPQVIQAVTFSSPIVGGHLTIWKGDLTIPKRSLWITRSLKTNMTMQKQASEDVTPLLIMAIFHLSC